MKLRFWGTRGSIPSPGPDTVKYGGNTTCVELRLDDGTLIVFDAGTGIRDLGLEIINHKHKNKINLFLSHSHWDHIQGFPFFRPAYETDNKINIFGCPPTYNKLREILTDQMESRYLHLFRTSLLIFIKKRRRGNNQVINKNRSPGILNSIHGIS